MNTARKGDIAELAVAFDLLNRGYEIAFPFGVSHDYDILLNRGQGFERVQVKYAEVKKGVIPVRCRTHSNTSAKQTWKTYSATMIDWLAVYEPMNRLICYVAATELANSLLHLRIEKPVKAQPSIRWAHDYQNI